MGSQNCVNFTAYWDYKINGTTSKLSSLNEFRLPAVSSLKSSGILGLAKQSKILSSNTKKRGLRGLWPMIWMASMADIDVFQTQTGS